jgi:hypothetical protein
MKKNGGRKSRETVSLPKITVPVPALEPTQMEDEIKPRLIFTLGSGLF